VAYSAARQDRTLLPDAASCPLCPGRGGEVPDEGFEIAVFPNRWPAFEPPLGASEVVVYTPEHEGSFAGLPAKRATALMAVWRDRYAELGARDDVHYVMPFENRGAAVGATLSHPHGQIYAFPFVPPVPAAEREADRRRGSCVICALAAEAGERLVYENGAFAAFVPWAARWPYELCVAAHDHRESLTELGDEELVALADALQAVTAAYDALFDVPLPYMLCLHSAPTDAEGGGHLHAELYTPARAPGMLKHLASCEQGAGTMLVDVAPERGAAELRTALAGVR
jgi:UDPglucose--hexose-1-phosphate uridylyltransferase